MESTASETVQFRGQITDPKSAMKYMLAGKATLTLRSLSSGNRYTYKVELADKRNPNDPNEPSVWFVSLLNGPDNWRNYAYIGMIKTGEFRWTGKSRVSKDAPSFVGFSFVYDSLKAETMRGFEFWHEDRCGRCGRPLTVPESIASGFGPDCLQMVGAAAAVAVPAPVIAHGQRNINFDGSARQPKAKPTVVVSGVAAPVPAPVNNDAEIRRRIEAYKSEAPENFYQDGMLTEKEAFDVAYNMFRLRIEREQKA